MAWNITRYFLPDFILIPVSSNVYPQSWVTMSLWSRIQIFYIGFLCAYGWRYLWPLKNTNLWPRCLSLPSLPKSGMIETTKTVPQGLCEADLPNKLRCGWRCTLQAGMPLSISRAACWERGRDVTGRPFYPLCTLRAIQSWHSLSELYTSNTRIMLTLWPCCGNAWKVSSKGFFSSHTVCKC